MVRKAIVIGSNGPNWQRLDYAEEDGRRVSKALKERGNFDVEFLSNSLSFGEIYEIVTRVAAAATYLDTLLIYFAGHGELLRGRLFLLLDQTERSIFGSAINALHFREALELSQAENKLLVLDCCHAGRATGFRGDHLPEGLRTGSNLILCASDHLEKARELANLRGGFMSHHIVELLKAPWPTTLTVNQLASELQKRADKHNIEYPTQVVPRPYLSGTDRAEFRIKQPVGPVAISVSFNGDQLNFPELIHTLRPYLTRPHAANVPVEVHLPEEIEARITILSEYSSSGKWPTRVDDRTIEDMRDIVKLGDRVKDDLDRVVRMIIVHGVTDDRSDLMDSAKKVLESYLTSKMIAFRRVLSSAWLYNEPDVPWRQQFHGFDTVWSANLIYGLTVLESAKRRWSFWTDADIEMDLTAQRIFVPQILGLGEEEIALVDENAFFEIIIPQLIEQDRLTAGTDLYVALKRPFQETRAKIRVRGSSIIETESHNFPDSNHPAKLRAARVAAGVIAEHFHGLPEHLRRDFVIKLYHRQGILEELVERVKIIAPDIDVYYWQDQS